MPNRTSSVPPRRLGTKPEKWLVRLIRFVAGLMTLAVFAVVMPFDWMDEVHRAMGLGELPDAPIVSYLTRSVSAMYAITGAVALFISADVRRYWTLIKVMAVALVTFGITVLVVDLSAPMPPLWVLSEGPFILAAGCGVLYLQRLAAKSPDSGDRCS